MKKFLGKFLIFSAICMLANHAIAQQAYNGVSQRPSDSPLIYGIFDLPDGTTITGNTLESGNSAWTNLGPGNFYATNGEGTNGNAGCTPEPSCSNTYNDFPNTSTLGGTPVPITYQWGTFRFNAGGMPLTLIADMATGPGAFVNFLHLNFGQNSWALTYCITGSCPVGFNLLGSGSFISPLILGSAYGIAWDIDEVNHKVLLHLPDGTTSGWYSFPSSLVPVYNRFQIGGFTNALSANWIAVGSGKQKSEAVVASGFGAPMAEITRLNGLQNKIVGSKNVVCTGAPPTPCPSSISTNFATFTTGSPQYANRLLVKVSATLGSNALPGTSYDDEDWVVPIYSTACCNTLDPTITTYSSHNGNSSVYLTGALSAILSGQTITFSYVGSISGPNTNYATGWRFQYSVESEGDCCGILTPQ